MQEGKFREEMASKFEGFEVQPSEGVWNSIDAKLKQKRRRGGILFFSVIGSIAALTASLLIFNPLEPEVPAVADKESSKSYEKTNNSTVPKESKGIVESNDPAVESNNQPKSSTSFSAGDIDRNESAIATLNVDDRNSESPKIGTISNDLIEKGSKLEGQIQSEGSSIAQLKFEDSRKSDYKFSLVLENERLAPMPVPDIKEDLLKQKRWQVSVSGGLYEYYQPNILTFSYFKNAVLYEGKQFPRLDGQYAISAGYNPFCNFWINAGLGARHYSERFNYSSYYVPHAPPNYEMQNVRYEQFNENETRLEARNNPDFESMLDDRYEESATVNYTFLQMHVTVGYEFLDRKVNLGLESGIIYNTLIRESADLSKGSVEFYELQAYQPSDSYFEYVLNPYIGYDLTRSIQVQIKPSLIYRFSDPYQNEVYPSDIHNWRYGLNLAASYRF